MKYRQHNDTAFLWSVINAVWKPVGNNTPCFIMHDGKLERIFRREREATTYLGHEFKSKANSLAFIPSTGFDKLGAGSAMERNWQAHRPILARAAAFTSFQESTSSGFTR